ENSRISIIIVNYNGLSHLHPLLESLQVQDYDDYEIIVVDNGSSDGSLDYIRQYYPAVRIAALDNNVGFAEGNNIGSEIASGDFLCLINNDTRAAPDFLRKLMTCITTSPRIGAVGAKMLFWSKFATLDFELIGPQKAKLKLDEDALRQSLNVYPKWFFSDGWESPQKDTDGNTYRICSRQAKLRIAVCEGQEIIKLRCCSTDPLQLKIQTSIPGITVRAELSADQWFDIEIDFTGQLNNVGLSYLINNAGTWVSETGNTGDRGFAEPDIGQYDKVELVDALCGGAMLIRTSALLDKPIFLKEFFAYYEDTELSLRLRKNGYDLYYCPEAVLYHKHASTSGENSPFFRFYVNRNKLLFLALNFKQHIWKNELQKAKSELNHLREFYSKTDSATAQDHEFAVKIPTIFDDWNTLLPKIENKSIYQRQPYYPRIGVFNNFWHTLGGGEHHACVVAHALQKFAPVDLISENDFEIESLEKQFGIDLKFCRKKIVTSSELHHKSVTTEKYDVFFNSTYGSDLISYAKHSFYIVSFPYQLDHRPPENREFLKYYTFLANSQYTKQWVQRWWNVNAEILYPSIMIPEKTPDLAEKEPLILHVGRFFRNGHNKKQLEIVRNFRRMFDAGKANDWRLVLVGQCSPENEDYLYQVKKEATGYPIQIKNNIPLNTLRSLYQKAAIYLHATGLGENSDINPELSEHFGITTVEAMSYGCVPVVINAGGQPEIVEYGLNGFLFDDNESLMQELSKCMELFNDNKKFNAIQNNAIVKSTEFSRENSITTIQEKFKEMGF
ncbi:MAG: glycosyltransferase, partial [Bacteroidetes bacterium]|nr:glycosyltransferase [Bacteroidota bacterium]